MNYLFPYDNIVIGILIFIVGFIFHWLGQLVSVINWEFATKHGLQESTMPAEYKVYEHGIAVADVIIGWIHGVAAVGLFLNISIGYKAALISGAILLYHSLSFWFWTRNRIEGGMKLETNMFRIMWTSFNFITGFFGIILSWTLL